MSSEDVKEEPTKTPKTPEKPGWLKSALQSRRTIKTWLRCCIALAATLVLMVDRRTSNTMGQAAFFVVIVSVMLPPTFALSVFLLASTTLLIGMLLGWAWGNAAMASALSVRSASLLAQQQQKLQSSSFFIHWNHAIRSSAVYGAFLFIGTFALGALRAHFPNLMLLSIFGTIVLDVMCTTGPLLPKAQYTLAKLFLIPTSFYIAVAIASLVLIFPESLSHVWLTSLLDTFWTPTLDLLRLQSEVLATTPSDHETWAEITARGNELRTNIVNNTEALSSQIKLIDLDTSTGRLGPADLKKINAQLRFIMFRAAGLQAFQTFVNDTNVADQKEVKEVEERLNRGDQTPRSVNRYQALQRKIKEREIQHGHDLDSLVPILAAASADLRGSSESAVLAMVDWLQDANSNRWAALFSRSNPATTDERHAKLVDASRKLEATLDEFKNVERIKLIKPFEKFFDPKTRKLLMHCDLFTSRSLYICFVFIDTLDAFAESIAKLLKTIIEIDSQRSKAKIWFPGRIVRATQNITNGEFKGTEGPLSMGTAENPMSFDEPSTRRSSSSTLDEDDDDDDQSEGLDGIDEEQSADPPSKFVSSSSHFLRNPDAFPPTTAFGRFIIKLAAVLRFFKSPEGIFALRMGIVSVALWVPAVCRTTAWFYYDNKGLWALITAQTGLGVYAGDQIAGFIIRLAGTLLGLLVGMAVWYIGAGLGHGNPYGVVVAATVILAPCIFLRISGPPAQVGLWTMMSVSVVFVTGYSWINANQVVLTNTGVGVALGWKRILLVIMGFTAAFIVMLFPHPRSSRVLIRKTLAAIIGEEGNIFGGEVEAFLAEEERARNGIYEKVQFLGKDGKDDQKMSPKERRVRKIAKRVIAVSTRLRFIYPSLTTAKFEPQLSGTWPLAQYQELFMLQSRVLGSLALLTTSFAKLDTKWCSALVRTPFMNPNFLSDVFTTITVLSNSLMNGHALPAYLPKLRDRIVYHEVHSRNGKRWKGVETDSASEVGLKAGAEAVDEEIVMAAGPANVDGSSIGIELDDLTLDVLLNEQLPAHSTAVVALSSLISRVDEMIDIIQTLCGQATFRGYDALQRDYLDREEKAAGGGYR
ncbi:hypothetical protein GALMADRAFT_78068 [Galerina marginata CBS 339.88]|uniref:ER transporter 6TM N-terminal domain-containing protein n=1 Tax=Galerina marginata (strain CBS 339.88) TaxID=685588 RepID=A0A067SFK1_GALM3|nr:hypothetical protein GALMADRAFT_78068 [Galerina marginata CBS 339.88]